MDSVSPSSYPSSSGSQPSQDGSTSSLLRRLLTAHHPRTGQGGLVYGVGVAWTHLRPFLPFFLISCLVVVLVHLMRVIVYSGPFTDPLFFHKFHQRWPRPHPPQGKTPQLHLDSNMTQ